MYRRNEDRLGMFLEEEMEAEATAEISIKSMYGPYQAWSEGRGERAMSQIAFTRKLQDRGVQVTGTGSRAMVLGYTTRAPQGGVSSTSFGTGFSWQNNPRDDGWA